MQRVLPVLTLIAGIAIGGAAFWWLQPRAADAPPHAVSMVPREPDIPTPELPIETAPEPGRRQAERVATPDEEVASESGHDTPVREVHYLVAEKYAAEPMSEVHHTLIGAWDENPASSTPGKRRGMVAVVDPSTSDRDLETLARDILDRNRDSVILSVRIYDSAEAAKSSPTIDGGALAFEHLVAEISRNTAIPNETVRVRGRLIEP